LVNQQFASEPKSSQRSTPATATIMAGTCDENKHP
jgi:hypothetical protein